MRSSGPVVRPLAARRSPTEELCSAAEAFGIDVRRFSLYYSKHSADKFELYGIHDASVSLSFRAFPLIIGSKLGIMYNGASGSFRQNTLELIVAGLTYMITPTDRCPGLLAQWTDTTEFCVLSRSLEAGEVTSCYYYGNGIYHPNTGDSQQQFKVLVNRLVTMYQSPDGNFNGFYLIGEHLGHLFHPGKIFLFCNDLHLSQICSAGPYRQITLVT